MKKKLALLLACTMALSLTACGGSKPAAQQQLRKQPQQQLQKAAQRAKLMRKQKQPAGIWML